MTSESMIDAIRLYGLENEKVFEAMRAVDRKNFVPEKAADSAYSDHPLHIGHGQTISQPYTVAFMLDALELRKGQKVLEIGAGSGWNAALIKHLVGRGRVVAVEYVEELAQKAKENIGEQGIEVEVVAGDGSLGYEKRAPYDRIIATCACPQIPLAWVGQLKPGGIIIAPVGRHIQNMVKLKGGHEEVLGQFSFVPLRGKLGM